MTPTEIRILVRRHADHYNARDAAALAADHTDNARIDSPAIGAQQGRREIEKGYQRWLAAFPDSEFRVESVIAENDRAAVFVLLSGTHAGDFLGLPATGRKFEFRAVLQLEFENGLICHERRIYDFSGLLIKLGVLKVKLAS